MNKSKKSWYYDDIIILALVFIVLMIVYAVGVSVFIAKGDDKAVGAFEVVTGISGLVLSLGTVFYVIQAYKAQREQIRIQNIQIEVQQREIEQNNKDVQFNRAVDIIYRQVSLSKDKLKATKGDFIKYCSNIISVNRLFKSYDAILRFLVLLDYENEFYKKLLSNMLLEDNEKEYLFKIHTSNLSYEYKQIVNRTISIVRKYPDIYELYKEYLYKEYDQRLMQNALAYNYYTEENDEKKKEIIIKEYGDEMKSVLHNFKLLTEFAKNIDTTFHEFNVWIK